MLLNEHHIIAMNLIKIIDTSLKIIFFQSQNGKLGNFFLLVAVLARKNECLLLQNLKKKILFSYSILKISSKNEAYPLSSGLRLIQSVGLQHSPGPLSLCVLLSADLAVQLCLLVFYNVKPIQGAILRGFPVLPVTFFYMTFFRDLKWKKTLYFPDLDFSVQLVAFLYFL